MTWKDMADMGHSAMVPAPTARLAGLYQHRIKRALDLFFIIASLPISLPLITLMALLVAMDGGNPFYCQPRVGRGGRVFRLLKIRTMVPQADRKLAEYLVRCPEARREWDECQKLKCDPRITRLGRLLRRSSMDELPQLWNVLRGDMSLVGPRPMMPDQETLYPGKAYYALRPGITGLWQVSARNETGFASRAEYDSQYLDTISFRTDMHLLMRTVLVVLRGTGY